MERSERNGQNGEDNKKGLANERQAQIQGRGLMDWHTHRLEGIVRFWLTGGDLVEAGIDGV